MTGAAIAQDKARQAGVTDAQDFHEPLTPEQSKALWWAFRLKLSAVMDAIAARDPEAVKGLPRVAPAGWDAHLEHPDAEYVERVRYQRRLMELLESKGYSYPQAMRQLRAEGWS